MRESEKHSFEQIKNNYKLPFLTVNMQVSINGKFGNVTGVSNSGLKAKLDNGKTVSFHPTWETIYYDRQGKIIADFRNKKS